jgi:hypothetical protein
LTVPVDTTSGVAEDRRMGLFAALRYWLESRWLRRQIARREREIELLQEELRIKVAAQAYTEQLRRNRRHRKRKTRKARRG